MQIPANNRGGHDQAHKVVSREEWLTARRQLLAEEKEFTRPKDAMRPDPIRWPGVAGTTNTRAEGWLARTRRQAICSDLAAFHHQGNMRGVLQQSHVAERVAGDDDEIGELALFDRADISFEPKALRRPAGRRPQCLQRRQPGFDEALDLHCVARMAVSAGIGSAVGELR